MSFKFIIPVKSEDLLTSDKNSYFVSRVHPPAEIPGRLKDARNDFRQSNSYFYIFDHFDTFFSVIEASDCPMATVIRSFDALFDTLEHFHPELGQQLKKTPISESDRENLSNATKMYIYLFVSTIKVIDTNNANNEGKVNNKKNNDFDLYHWEKKRKDGLDLLYNIAQLPLENLYDPPVMEEDFVNLICETSYRTLQLIVVKDRRVTETAFQIIGVAIKRFNHALNFPVRILQILSDKDYCITPIANATHNILYQEFGITSIFDVLIKELSERLMEDTADQKLSKHYSQFLVDLSMAAPTLMIPHLSDLAEELLNHEPYVLRNSLLQIMGDIIVRELSKEGLEDELKETRDEFLDFLYEHIHDANAHVRSKVLQVWCALKTEGAVPISRIHKVLERTVGRLDDKSSLVRKNAAILVKSFLEHNPFSSRLTHEQLQEKYEEAENKMRDLQKKRADVIPMLEEFELEWERKTTDIQTVILNNVATNISLMDVDQLSNIGEEVGNLLKEEKYKEALELVRKGDANNEEVSELTFEQKCQYYFHLLKSYYDTIYRPNDYTEEINKADDTVKFFFDFIQYTKLLAEAVPKLEEMLMSKTNSDVFEAIDFFTTAFQFSIKNCENGMHKMIYLVWSDKEKREAVTEAYKKVLFTTDKKDRAHAVQVVENLSRFIEHLNQGHYSAFEELMKEWVDDETIDPSIIQVMFEKYTKKLPETSENDSRLALQLLVLCSAANPNIVTRNLDFLVQMGIQENGLEDPRIYTATLDLLINAVEKEHDHPSKYYKRYDHNSDIVEQVVSTYKNMFFTNNDIDFDTICIKTFNFIYRLCNAPDVLSQVLVLSIYERMKQISERLECRVNDSENIEPTFSQSQSQSKIILNLPTIILARFVYMIGFVAMKEMIYLDIDVYSNLKYREELRNEQKKQVKSKSKGKTPNKRITMVQSLDISASNALKRMTMATTADTIEEEDLVGATAEDAIAEQIQFICETEMLYSSDCLGKKFHPLILELCQYINRHKDDSLQQSVVLAMIHLMSVSSRFCEDNVPFLMNVFQHTKNIRVKCNIIIGLADFTFRFPNVIEPWTAHLYATLHESDPELRLTAVKMLSHLILHEMIRVKGQISDLALCLVDPVPEIKIMTEQFFKEIAHKSNILYNVLPDIISRLSDSAVQVEEGKYRIIMKYIMALISKEKQVESLVEKLCLRFKITINDRQWRDIAYCLSLLTYNEKTIKKLTEHIPSYKDKVQVNEVYESFKTIITNTMKLVKPELKIVVQEFETRLEECLAVNDNPLGQEVGDKNADTSELSVNNRAKHQKNIRRAGRNIPNRGRRKDTRSSSDESEDSDFENRNPHKAVETPVSTAASRRSVRAPKTVTKVIENSDSSDSAEQPLPKRRVRGGRR